MGATTRRPHSFLLAILAAVLMSVGGLVAWAARPPRPPRRPVPRPHAARPAPPARRPHPRVHPLRPRPLVRVVPRVAPVIIHDIEPETEEVVRDVSRLPAAAIQQSDGKGE